MKLKVTHVDTGIVVWQHDKASHHAQGGYNLDLTGLTPGAIVPAGSPVGVIGTSRVATLLKTAKVVEAVSAAGKAIKVAKGHLFLVGDFVLKGSVSTKINTINSTNPNFDTLNVQAALGALAEGDALVSGTAELAENAVPAVVPIGLTYKSATVPADDVLFVDVRLRGTVYARRIPALPIEVQAKLPNIIFSQSF